MQFLSHSTQETEAIGEELAQKLRGGVCAVEWSERVSDALPEDTLWVDIARGSGENDRIITITGGEAR